MVNFMLCIFFQNLKIPDNRRQPCGHGVRHRAKQHVYPFEVSAHLIRTQGLQGDAVLHTCVKRTELDRKGVILRWGGRDGLSQSLHPGSEIKGQEE